MEDSLENTVNYLKRKVELCKDFKKRRSVKRSLYKKRDSLRKQKKTRTDRRITSPHLELTSVQKRRSLDYTANIRAVVASFYVGTGGLDVGSVNLVQGIKEGKNWEVTSPWNSKGVCKTILSVVE